MQNSSGRCGARLRRTLLTAAATAAFPITVFAKDLPATPEGAQKLGEVLAAYLGKPAAGASPAVTVTLEGPHYAVALDLANLAAPLSATGFSVDPAIVKSLVTEQDDGTWRVAIDSLPPVSFQAKDAKFAYNFGDYKFEGVFDPALGSFKSGQANLANAKLESHAPKMDQSVTVAAVHATNIATPAAGGAASLAVHEEVVGVSANISPAGEAKDGSEAKPDPISVQLATALADVSADGAPMRKLLDLWAFLAAHPSRPELAANEQAFKTLLRAAIPVELKLAEKVEMKEVAIGAPQGRFGLADGKFSLAASAAAGPKGSAEYSFAVEGLSLPPGLLEPAMSDLVPNAFNIGIKASGFDAGAGAEEAVKAMHFAGDGPIISETDGNQILAKMKGPGPIAIELLPSHILAPRLDLTLEGQARLDNPRPSGVLKLHVRNFDKTVAALKALGPLATPQLLGGLALARTLAKSESDGALTWVAEYGPDGAVKVNGMPLGKAP
jgi:hypothetical protein